MDFVKFIGTLMGVIPPPESPEVYGMKVVAREGTLESRRWKEVPVTGIHMEEGKLVIEL